jgi:hypothetical protein
MAARTKKNVNERRLAEMRVDELRQMARQQGVSGSQGMRKADLVTAVARGVGGTRGAGGTGRGATRATRGRPVCRGPASSRSLRYAQEITSPDQQPERATRTLVTTNHEVIRRWAQERGAVPATIEGSQYDNRPGVLTFDFPGGAEGGRLRHISWAEWFRTFDARGLNFIYQEQRSDGRRSNFFRLENPLSEDA